MMDMAVGGMLIFNDGYGLLFFNDGCGCGMLIFKDMAVGCCFSMVYNFYGVLFFLLFEDG
jgi:hypothetical protein